MKAIPFHSTFTFPVRTYWRTMSGNAPVMYWSQPGHWMSANSCIVTGAFGLPSTPPLCGMPARSLLVAAADGIDAVFGDDELRELRTLAPTRTTASRRRRRR